MVYLAYEVYFVSMQYMFQEGFAFSHCTECRAFFKLRANVPADRWWLRLRFQLLVARDHAFIFISVQMIVAFLGLLVYKFYGEELREMFGYEEHPYGFYTLAGTTIFVFYRLMDISPVTRIRVNQNHLCAEPLERIMNMMVYFLLQFWPLSW
jgi:hypothetical protein